jgi:hypothetical protein
MASRVGRGIAVPFLDRGIRRGLVVNSTLQPHFTPGKDPVPIVQEAGWAPGPVWTEENLVPLGFDLRTVQPVVSLSNVVSRSSIYLVRVRKTSINLSIISVPAGIQIGHV